MKQTNQTGMWIRRGLLPLLLALACLIVLAGCSILSNPLSFLESSDQPLSRDDGETQTSLPTESNTAEESAPTPDFASIISGNAATDTVWGKQDEASKQRIIEQAKQNGYDLSFDADGGMTIKGPDGEEMRQNPDGTWVYHDENGGTQQYGGDWPENEFTKQVPKPDFDVRGASTDDDGFSVVFAEASLDEIRAYASKLKAAGFRENEELTDQEIMGVVIYTFMADNEAGYTVKLTSANGVSGLSISK